MRIIKNLAATLLALSLAACSTIDPGMAARLAETGSATSNDTAELYTQRGKSLERYLEGECMISALSDGYSQPTKKMIESVNSVKRSLRARGDVFAKLAIGNNTMIENGIMDFGVGTSFVKANGLLILKRLFSMTCAYNGKLNGDVPSVGGTFTAFCNKKRYDSNKLILDDIENRNDELIFTLKSVDGLFSVVQKWRYDASCELLHCTYKISNDADAPLTFNRALPQFTFSNGDYELYTQRSAWGRENIG